MRSDSTLPPTRPAATAGTRAALGMSLGTIGGLLAALVAMLVLFGTLSPTFFSLPTFTTIANEIPDLLVMAVGMTFILMIGGIDLSVGSVLALSASVLSVAMNRAKSSLKMAISTCHGVPHHAMRPRMECLTRWSNPVLWAVISQRVSQQRQTWVDMQSPQAK